MWRSDKIVILSRVDATVNGKTTISGICWYVAHFTPSVTRQIFLNASTVSTATNEISCVQRSITLKPIDQQSVRISQAG